MRLSKPVGGYVIRYVCIAAVPPLFFKGTTTIALKRQPRKHRHF